MGTRNLTCVVKNKQYRVAKYGQWDGYPESLGIKILMFLRDTFDRSEFEQNLNNVSFIDEKQLNDLWVSCDADQSDLENGWVDSDVTKKFRENYFELSRDCTGDEILKLIQKGKIKWQQNSIDFASDGLFCEWCYVIDLDKNTFEIYKGFNKSPLHTSERFFNLNTDHTNGYYPVKLLQQYNLTELPDNKRFLKDVDQTNNN
jgi:hypothetical protein